MMRLAGIMLVAIAVVGGAANLSEAQKMAAAAPHDNRESHESDRDHHDDHHDGKRDDMHRPQHFGGGPIIYWNPYYYAAPTPVYPTPLYWYYCPSAAAYYPYVEYCADPWVPVLVR